jgi:hypothetical protein
MIGRRSALTILATTLILSLGMALIPNGSRPSDNLLNEILPPMILAGVFSIVTGYVASRGTGRLHNGAIGGGLNALANLGFLLLLLSLADRHFRTIGGPGLIVELPLVVPVGAGLGSAGAIFRRLTHARAEGTMIRQ